jgi:hypothetical protein
MGTMISPGELKSTSRASKPIRYNKTIEAGIHVFLNKNDANYISYIYQNFYVIKCKAKISQLIAVGEYGHYSNTAVFRSIYVPRTEYIRITKKHFEMPYI